MPKEIPLLFSTPMAQANLDLAKSETRRIIKGVEDSDKVRKSVFHKSGWETTHGKELRHRYGNPGDILYQRETVYEHGNYFDGTDFENRWIKNGYYGYATEAKPSWGETKTRPSIHMPKEQARVWMENFNVFPDKLKYMTEEDALNEGIRKLTKDGNVFKYCVFDKGDYSSTPWQDMPRTALDAYKALWIKINGTWNPETWVWVVKYKILSTTGKPINM